jgi:pimeloyl-ACP methyl ester carboxylesterase
MRRWSIFSITLLLIPIALCALVQAYVPPKGVVVELVEIPNAGRLIQGAFFTPDPNLFKTPATGVILVHGVESYWYSGPPMFLACFLAEQGYATLGYNGVHSGESFRTSEFEVAVKEVGAVIQYMKGRGIKDIFLVGHSLGTPIVEYYQGDNPDPAVKAAGVYGPHINIPAITRDSLLGAEMYVKFVTDCREAVAQGKGNELKLLPYREGRFIITSAKTFLSYRDIDTSKAAVEKMIRQIRVPLLIGYDPNDNIQGRGALTKRETLVNQIKENAVASPKVDILVAPPIPGENPMEAHALIKNEKFVVQATMEWLKSVGLPPALRQ